jgi:hypothetical protein
VAGSVGKSHVAAKKISALSFVPFPSPRLHLTTLSFNLTGSGPYGLRHFISIRHSMAICGKLGRQNRGFKRERTFGHGVFLRARKAVRGLKAFPITSGLRYVPFTERIFQCSFPQTLPVESCNARPNLRTLYHEHARTAPEPK